MPIRIDMETNSNFTSQLLAALDEKIQWYDNEQLPYLLENFRLLHTCVKNLFEFLVKKSLITPDPYKLDKKISDIKSPDSAQFVESERSVIMGQRFSDYESTLDFLCTYYKFSVSQLTLGNIKKLVDLSNAFIWTSFSVNSNRVNTRVLANLVADGRHNSDAMTSSMINDSLGKASHAATEINEFLKKFTDFRREVYKGDIRRKVMGASGFDMQKALSSPASELQQIKKNFAAGMGKVPFFNELVDEIIQEDQAPDKEARQAELLSKLDIEKKSVEKQEEKVDTKAMLMEAMTCLGAMTPLLTQTIEKIKENHDVLESEHNSFFSRLMALLRKSFGIEDKPLYYNVVIVEQTTSAKRKERINYQMFVGDLTTKARRFSALSQKGSSGYNKLLSMSEAKILEFISAQIVDCQKMLVLLNALDDFFKTSVAPVNKPRIKGLKIDITSLKNTVVKANQYRAEYSAYIEEEAQMRKLGIK